MNEWLGRIIIAEQGEHTPVIIIPGIEAIPRSYVQNVEKPISSRGHLPIDVSASYYALRLLSSPTRAVDNWSEQDGYYAGVSKITFHHSLPRPQGYNYRHVHSLNSSSSSYQGDLMFCNLLLLFWFAPFAFDAELGERPLKRQSGLEVSPKWKTRRITPAPEIISNHRLEQLFMIWQGTIVVQVANYEELQFRAA